MLGTFKALSTSKVKTFKDVTIDNQQERRIIILLESSETIRQKLIR